MTPSVPSATSTCTSAQACSVLVSQHSAWLLAAAGVMHGFNCCVCLYNLSAGCALLV
jgi:transcriptional regulator GlxA family with amidase domain